MYQFIWFGGCIWPFWVERMLNPFYLSIYTSLGHWYHEFVLVYYLQAYTEFKHICPLPPTRTPNYYLISVYVAGNDQCILLTVSLLNLFQPRTCSMHYAITQLDLISVYLHLDFGNEWLEGCMVQFENTLKGAGVDASKILREWRLMKNILRNTSVSHIDLCC